MKQINNYWVDENNNKWDCGIYTEEQAENFSKSLIDCHSCIDYLTYTQSPCALGEQLFT